jgi:serine protease Do
VKPYPLLLAIAKATIMKSKQTFYAALLALCAAVGYGWAEVPHLTAVKPVQVAAADVKPTMPVPGVAVPDFSAMVARYGPAVVNISTSGTAPGGEGMGQMPQMSPNDPFWQFFRQFQAPNQMRRMPVQGLGSGFIITLMVTFLPMHMLSMVRKT